MLEGMQSESLKRFMNEIVKELGIDDYINTDKSKLASYIHGAVGGTSSKLLNELGQKVVSEVNPDSVRSLMDKYSLHVPEDVVEKSNDLKIINTAD